MKNLLTIFSQLSESASTLLLIDAATLEFCYDHVSEDYQYARQEFVEASKQEGFQETE